MGFYGQHVVQVTPGEVAGYGSGTEISYLAEDGAARVPVPFGVDLQPIENTDQPNGQQTGRLDRWTLHTPPGRELEVTATSAFEWHGKLLCLTNVRTWPSADYPSGVDHQEIELEERTGSA